MFQVCGASRFRWYHMVWEYSCRIRLALCNQDCHHWLFLQSKLPPCLKIRNQNCIHALKFAISICNQIAIISKQNVLQSQSQSRVNNCNCKNDCNLIAIIFAILKPWRFLFFRNFEKAKLLSCGCRDPSTCRERGSNIIHR